METMTFENTPAKPTVKAKIGWGLDLGLIYDSVEYQPNINERFFTLYQTPNSCLALRYIYTFE